MKEIRRHLRSLHIRRGPVLRISCLVAGILVLCLLTTRSHKLDRALEAKPLYFVSIGEFDRFAFCEAAFDPSLKARAVDLSKSGFCNHALDPAYSSTPCHRPS